MDTDNKSLDGAHSVSNNVKQLFWKYYEQVLNGCGNEKCMNDNCASSGRTPKLNSNEAAAKALTLLRSHAAFCDDIQVKCVGGDLRDSPDSKSVANVLKLNHKLPTENENIKRQKSCEATDAIDIQDKINFVSFMDIEETEKSPIHTPRKSVDFLNETKLTNLIDECKLSNDFAPLRRTLGQIFCNAESVNASFRLPDSAVFESSMETIDVVNVDIISARRAFAYLFSIEELPFLHALVNALTYLFENAELDLRYQRAFEKDADFVNMFILIMEMPILNEPQFENAFGCLCRAASRLPLVAQAKLVKFWSKYDAEHLLSMVRDVQQFITVKICTGAFVRNHYVQNDRGITSAMSLLRMLNYASLIGGEMDSEKVLLLEKELYAADDCELQSIFRQIDVGRGDSREGVATNNMKYMRGTAAAREDPLGKFLNICHLDVRKPLVPSEEFYNDTLCEFIQMDEDFKNFKHGEENDNRQGTDDEHFSFMLSPFVLQPATKMQGLFYDNRIRMLNERRHALFETILSGTPSAPYLRLRVRRNHVVHDTLALLEIITSDSPSDLKKQLFIEFENEQGVDEGGVSKEFYQLITEQLFNPDYGMFVYNSSTSLFWFNGHCTDCAAEYSLIGMLFGLAIYNNIIVDVQFPLVLHKKLMNKLGTMDDLKDLDLMLYNSLKSLLEYEKDDFDDVFNTTFRVSAKDVFGTDVSHDLKPNGDDLRVTKDNRQEFVDLYVDYLLNQSIEQQFRAFRRGFLMVVNESPLFWLFRPDELEQLVCGSKSFDFGALEKSTDYDNGYNESHPVIKNFWEVVHEMSVNEKKQLLQFATGSDRIPIGGMSKLHFIIARNGADSDKLPTAHTCFNVLLLPEYSTKEKLRERLLKAITYSKGFGLL